jgi:hypothetical protein
LVVLLVYFLFKSHRRNLTAKYAKNYARFAKVKKKENDSKFYIFKT